MKYLTIFVFLILCVTSKAQISVGGNPELWKSSDALPNMREITTPALDITSLNEEDRQDEINNIPPRFGFEHKVVITPNSSGTWLEGKNGGRIWVLKIKCPNALSINFLFNKFHLLPNTRFYIYNNKTKQKLGAFTELNNKGTLEIPRGFGTGLVFGSEVILEMDVPDTGSINNIIELSGIVHGYRLINIPDQYKEPADMAKTSAVGFGGSNTCQVNINCPEGGNWQNEKKGVALILVKGIRWCTGSLINNTCNNGELYFLTANHCIDGAGRDAQDDPNADDFSFWWNYESPNCNNPNSEPDPSVTNGAVVVANHANSDFALLRLIESPHNQTPPIDVYYNGWSRTISPSSGGVGIHHPRGDIKKISTYNMRPDGNSTCRDPNQYWEVRWAPTQSGHSIQEPGSSGSPLITNDKKIIGQLYGPAACEHGSCDDPNEQQVVYGRFHVSWNSQSSAIRKLEPWLDPCGKNPIEWKGGVFDACTNQLVTVTGTVSNPRVYQSGNKLTSDATITIGTNVRFRANNEIELTNGFDAKNGSLFVAEIFSCKPEFTQAKLMAGTPTESKGEIRLNDNVSIFPIPFGEKLSINFHLQPNTEARVVLTDIYGKQHGTKTVRYNNGDEQAVFENLQNLSSGLYILTLFREGKVSSHKIVKYE